jgi:hypothetical protein
MKWNRDCRKFNKYISTGSSVRKARPREDGHYESNFTISVRNYKCAAHLQKTREMQWSRYHITVCQFNTAIHAVHWLTERFEFGMFWFIISRWKLITLNFVAALPGNISYYVTIHDLPTFPIYCQLQNTQWSDEYSVYKINADIHLILSCLWQWNYSQQQAACVIPNRISSQIRTMRVIAVCLMFVPLHKNLYVRMLG